MCLGGAGCMWRTPLQALIIWSTISAAPRLCSRACWYRSLCFSISFSWGRARPTGLSEFRLSSPAFPLTDSSLFPVFLLQPHLLVHSFSCDPPLALGTEVCDLPLVPSQGWAWCNLILGPQTSKRSMDKIQAVCELKRGKKLYFYVCHPLTEM